MEHEHKRKKTVHHVLAHSYMVYFFALMTGLFLDILYPLPIGYGMFYIYIGLAFIMIGSILIIWAQQASSHLRRKKEEVTHVDFRKGPYNFVRTPTQLGLSFLIFGYGLLANSLLICLAAVAAHTVAQLVFIPKVERFLEDSYGAHYIHYKKRVSKI